MPRIDAPRGGGTTQRDQEDGNLAAGFRGGDMTAFEAFYRRYETPVYRTVFALLRDTMTCEEVVTDTFLRAYAARERLDPDRPPLPWLQRIAVNLAMNHLRRRRLGLAPLPAAAPWPDDADEPDAAYARREMTVALAGGIERLPERMRLVVILRFVQDSSLAEIAEILGCPVGTVKSRLHNALRLLRDDLGHELAPSDAAAPRRASRTQPRDVDRRLA